MRCLPISRALALAEVGVNDGPEWDDLLRFELMIESHGNINRFGGALRFQLKE